MQPNTDAPLQKYVIEEIIRKTLSYERYHINSSTIIADREHSTKLINIIKEAISKEEDLC